MSFQLPRFTQLNTAPEGDVVLVTCPEWFKGNAQDSQLLADALGLTNVPILGFSRPGYGDSRSLRISRTGRAEDSTMQFHGQQLGEMLQQPALKEKTLILLGLSLGGVQAAEAVAYLQAKEDVAGREPFHRVALLMTYESPWTFYYLKSDDREQVDEKIDKRVVVRAGERAIPQSQIDLIDRVWQGGRLLDPRDVPERYLRGMMVRLFERLPREEAEKRLLAELEGVENDGVGINAELHAMKAQTADKIPRVLCPTLLLHGGGTDASIKERNAQIAEVVLEGQRIGGVAIPSVSVTSIPKIGHNAGHDQRGVLPLARLVGSFVQAVLDGETLDPRTVSTISASALQLNDGGRRLPAV